VALEMHEDLQYDLEYAVRAASAQSKVEVSEGNFVDPDRKVSSMAVAYSDDAWRLGALTMGELLARY